jgi:hypothetical protein
MEQRKKIAVAGVGRKILSIPVLLLLILLEGTCSKLEDFFWAASCKLYRAIDRLIVWAKSEDA